MNENPVMSMCSGRLDWAIHGVLAVWLSLRLRHIDSNVQALYETMLEVRGRLNAAEMHSFVDDAPLREWLSHIDPGWQRASLLNLTHDLLNEVLPRADLEYMVLRSLRRYLHIGYCPEAAHWVHHCTEKLREMTRSAPHSRYLPNLLEDALDEALHLDPASEAKRETLSASAYLTVLTALGIIISGSEPPELYLGSQLDAEWILGRLFGMPTQIPGFDAMFAGTGLKLVDAVPGAEQVTEGIGGRTILLIGPFGSGKSTLTLEFALEVARKGGMALVVAMEQTVEECLFSLEGLGVSTQSRWFDIVDDPVGAVPLVIGPYEGRHLCYQYYRARHKVAQKGAAVASDGDAVVWRAWYGSLAQMLRRLSPEERDKIRVQPLFGPMAMAGEWYLAIPRYSAATEVGWRLIDILTSPEAEIERLYNGIGLPTHASFYQSGETKRPDAPFFQLAAEKLGELVNKAFERSRFTCYPQFSPLLSAHLTGILEVSSERAPFGSKAERDVVSEAIAHLRNNMRFLQFSASPSQCSNCKNSKASVSKPISENPQPV